MLLFQSEEHVDRWCYQWHQPHGGILTLDQIWELAKEWYGSDRREPAWRRKTLDEVEGLFKQLGLTDPFWQLSR